MKRDIKKLKLNLETLRTLEPAVLASVEGGYPPTTEITLGICS